MCPEGGLRKTGAIFVPWLALAERRSRMGMPEHRPFGKKTSKNNRKRLLFRRYGRVGGAAAFRSAQEVKEAVLGDFFIVRSCVQNFFPVDNPHVSDSLAKSPEGDRLGLKHAFPQQDSNS
jgi:hypothetical protein